MPEPSIPWVNPTDLFTKEAAPAGEQWWANNDVAQTMHAVFEAEGLEAALFWAFVSGYIACYETYQT